MMIKDLEMSKDLDRDALSAVRGGRNSIEQGGVYAPVANVGGGFSFASPTTIVSAPRSVPFGKYWRSSRFVFSLVPRCHGLRGSQK